MKKLCYSKGYYLVAQGPKKVNSSNNDRFTYDMIGETQPETKFLEVVGMCRGGASPSPIFSNLQESRSKVSHAARELATVIFCDLLF